MEKTTDPIIVGADEGSRLSGADVGCATEEWQSGPAAWPKLVGYVPDP